MTIELPSNVFLQITFNNKQHIKAMKWESESGAIWPSTERFLYTLKKKNTEEEKDAASKRKLSWYRFMHSIFYWTYYCYIDMIITLINFYRLKYFSFFLFFYHSYQMKMISIFFKIIIGFNLRMNLSEQTEENMEKKNLNDRDNALDQPSEFRFEFFLLLFWKKRAKLYVLKRVGFYLTMIWLCDTKSDEKKSNEFSIDFPSLIVNCMLFVADFYSISLNFYLHINQKIVLDVWIDAHSLTRSEIEL